jgi:hypothetical protein
MFGIADEIVKDGLMASISAAIESKDLELRRLTINLTGHLKKYISMKPATFTPLIPLLVENLKIKDINQRPLVIDSL